jgi:ubiquinone/menaquinone biosynthesis C-methylase UbiE
MAILRDGLFNLRMYWLKCLLLSAVLVVTVGCGPSMKDYKGHRVFNPSYLFYLESSSRDKWQKPEEVLDALELVEGNVIADIGAGGGYFSEKLAGRVGPTGHVYATDVQEVMIKKLHKRVSKRSLTNVTVIHGDFHDPNLPSASCDWVFFCSVYKEIDERPAYMRKVRDVLKKDGRAAILEYRPDAEGAGPPLEVRLPEAQVIGELEAAGFRLQRRFDFLPRQYFLVFGLAPESVD